MAGSYKDAGVFCNPLYTYILRRYFKIMTLLSWEYQIIRLKMNFEQVPYLFTNMFTYIYIQV